MASRICLPVLVLSLLLSAGCNPVDMATRGFKEVKGAEADIRAIRELPAAELAEHSTIQVSRVFSSVGDLVPPEFVAQVNRNLRAQLAGLRNLGGRGEPLMVTGDITYYQTQDTASVLLGRTKMAIMHVTVATASGVKIGDFLAITTSEALRTGAMEMASSLSHGVATYFKRKLPG
jgi:hypothetical protein